jgi:hypothetical protein
MIGYHKNKGEIHMSAFDFISHESFPEDEYTKEAVVLCIEKKHRVTYVRKKMQTGAMFWDVISASVKQQGEKKYLKSYSQDSNFLQEDIKHFLESRSWEKGGRVAYQSDEVPF